MSLRLYQRDLYDRVRAAFGLGHRRVCMVLPTGAGKTRIFVAMVESAARLGRRVWIIVPRDELLRQASEALTALGVAHGVIAAGRQESAAFTVHLVSRQTLVKRWDKVRVWPDFVIVDECHLGYRFQRELQERAPASTKFVGVTATPERLDGLGLADLYDVMVEGPDLVTLTEQGYLAPIVYYAPFLEGLENVHRASNGYDYDEAELASLFERRKVYGSAIEHYQRHADGRSTIVFARSVAAAEEVAHRFSAAGYRFEPISGGTPKRQRVALVDGLRSGELTGLCNCEVATYGLDVPRVSCLILLRPTLSRAFYSQMVGRGLRVFDGKSECTIIDHVNAIEEFRHPYEPHAWHFAGREKRKRNPDPTVRGKICVEAGYLWCEKSSCIGCEHNTTGRRSLVERVVDCQLREVAPPVKLADRPIEERREYQDRIGDATTRARVALDDGRIDAGAIGELLALARQTKREPMSVYWLLWPPSVEDGDGGKLTVNETLINEIGRQMHYKPKWPYFARKLVLYRLYRDDILLDYLFRKRRLV